MSQGSNDYPKRKLYNYKICHIHQYFPSPEPSYINLWRILVPGVLSKRIFPSRTEGYSHHPTELHSERLLVPRFMRLKLAHFMPMWQAKSFSMQRRRAKTASLGCLNLIQALNYHGKTNPEGVFEEWHLQSIKDVFAISKYQGIYTMIKIDWYLTWNLFEPRNAKPDWWVRSI